ncbi:MAG: hypothetical protein HYS33_04140 [Acidobacteria bacterium]|nr:hypothetical protein [Acidobacteriota bacterium]
MTIEELERGFELHEKRLQAHEVVFARIDERLDRMSARDDEHERRLSRIEETLRGLSDHLVVQGKLLNGVDQRLDRLTAIVESHTNQLAVLQSAMTSLFQRMDAFIRGLERGNGDALPNQ